MRKLRIIAIVLGLLAIPALGLAMTHPTSHQLVNWSPMLSGTVESITDHSFTLLTDEGERMEFGLDSRTLLPAHFETGDRVALEFAMLQDGARHADRVVPAEQYMSMSSPSDHEAMPAT